MRSLLRIGLVAVLTMVVAPAWATATPWHEQQVLGTTLPAREGAFGGGHAVTSAVTDVASGSSGAAAALVRIETSSGSVSGERVEVHERPAGAAAWQHATAVHPLASGWRTVSGSVAADGSAAVLVTDGSGGTVRLLRRDGDGSQPWQAPQAIPDIPADSRPVEVHVLPDGDVLVLAMPESDFGVMRVATLGADGAWKPVGLPFGDANVYRGETIVTPGGSVALFAHSSSTQYIARRIDGAWQPAMTAPAEVGTAGGPYALGDDGTLAMLVQRGYWQDTGCSTSDLSEPVYGPESLELHVLQPDGTWGARQDLQLGDQGDEAGNPLVAVGPDGSVLVAWREWRGHVDIHPEGGPLDPGSGQRRDCHNRVADSPLAWHLETRNASGRIAEIPMVDVPDRQPVQHLRMDADGRIVVVRKVNEGSVLVSVRDDGTWSTSQSAPDGGSLSGAPELTASGELVVSWSGAQQVGVTTASLRRTCPVPPPTGRARGPVLADAMTVGVARLESLDCAPFIQVGGRWTSSKFYAAGVKVFSARPVTIDDRAGTIRFNGIGYLSASLVPDGGPSGMQTILATVPSGTTLRLDGKPVELSPGKGGRLGPLQRAGALSWKPRGQRSTIGVGVHLPKEIGSMLTPNGRFGTGNVGTIPFQMRVVVFQGSLTTDSLASRTEVPVKVLGGAKLGGIAIDGLTVTPYLNEERVVLSTKLGVRFRGMEMKGLGIMLDWGRIDGSASFGVRSVGLDQETEVPLGSSGLFLRKLEGRVARTARRATITGRAEVSPGWYGIGDKLLKLAGAVTVRSNGTQVGTSMQISGDALLPLYSDSDPLIHGNFGFGGNGTVTLGGRSRVKVAGGEVDAKVRGSVHTGTSHFEVVGGGTLYNDGGAVAFTDVMFDESGGSVCAYYDGGGPAMGWQGAWTDLSWPVKPCQFQEPAPRARISGRRSRDTQLTFEVPSGVRAYLVDLTGTGGAPHVTLVGPGGVRLGPPGADAGGLLFSNVVQVVEDQERSRTTVVLRSPAAGTWTVAEEAGTPSVASMAVALPAPAPRATVRVRASESKMVVMWQAVGHVENRTFQLVERGRGTTRVLGALSGRAGTITRPAVAGGDMRSVDLVVRDHGRIVLVRKVASFPAPPYPQLRPVGVVARFDPSQHPRYVQVRPRPPLPGASSYVITVQGLHRGRWHAPISCRASSSEVARIDGGRCPVVPKLARRVRVWLQAVDEYGRTTPRQRRPVELNYRGEIY